MITKKTVKAKSFSSMSYRELMLLKESGYIEIKDPTDPKVQKELEAELQSYTK